MRAGERVATVAPVARNALRTVAKSLAAPHALVVEEEEDGATDDDPCDGVVIIVDSGSGSDVDVVVMDVSVFFTKADSRVYLSRGERLPQNVRGDLGMGVDVVVDDDDVIVVLNAFVVFVVDGSGGGASVTHAHRALGSSPGPSMRAHDPTCAEMTCAKLDG